MDADKMLQTIFVHAQHAETELQSYYLRHHGQAELATEGLQVAAAMEAMDALLADLFLPGRRC